jgi:hypothetical protein
MIRDWIIIGVLYVLALGFFRLLGGWNAAGQAFERWGRASAASRSDQLSPSSS